MSVLPVLVVLAVVVLAPVVLALLVAAVLGVDGRVEARDAVGAALDRGRLATPPLVGRGLRVVPPQATPATPASGAREVRALRERLDETSR